jgi:LmbE family N-acetylglucosaminyl deacetylase
MIFIPPEAKKVLVVSPHPDDETIGCGGIVALYGRRGSEVSLVTISDGSKLYGSKESSECERIAEIRKRESTAASHELGIKNSIFLQYPDGELRSNITDIGKKLKDIISDIKPDIIFSPSLIDYHDDHMSTAEAVIWLSNILPDLKIAFYNVYSAIRFNMVVDITEVMEVKERAMKCYNESLFRVPYIFIEAVKGLNRFFSFYIHEQRYYESFYITDGPVDANDLLRWYVYERFVDPASEFLSKLQIADELLNELKLSELEVQKYTEMVNDLSRRLLDRERIIEQKEWEICELRRSLEIIREGLPWKLAGKYYRVRDYLFPENSPHRRVYNKIVNYLRTKII